jgi:hypothetical protein
MAEIVHLVLVQWRDAAATAEMERLVDERLPAIAGVVALERGAGIGSAALADGFDWALFVRLADRAALEAYGPDPDHVVVADFLRAEAERFVVLDFEASPPR